MCKRHEHMNTWAHEHMSTWTHEHTMLIWKFICERMLDLITNHALYLASLICSTHNIPACCFVINCWALNSKGLLFFSATSYHSYLIYFLECFRRFTKCLTLECYWIFFHLVHFNFLCLFKHLMCQTLECHF